MLHRTGALDRNGRPIALEQAEQVELGPAVVRPAPHLWEIVDPNNELAERSEPSEQERRPASTSSCPATALLTSARAGSDRSP
jgi:hypothetical protein